MAFDPPYVDVAQEFISQNSSFHFQPMQGITERELKLSIPAPTKVVSLSSNNRDFLIRNGALKIKALLSSLQDDGIWHDGTGDIPNDYVLASLNLDTIEGANPTAQFYRNRWQCRIRTPLWVHDENVEFNYPAMLRKMDANMKTLLSDQAPAGHRIELEEIVRQHPSSFFREFKRVVQLPDFTKTIEDRHLRVSDICLTSRTGFYVVIKDPQSDCHVLLHGTYDASNFVASNVFTRKDLRLETELEAKGIISKDTKSMSAGEQDSVVNRVFALIAQKAKPLGLEPFTLSKLEESMFSAHHYYRTQNGPLPNFAAHLDSQGISHSTKTTPSLHHLYAIAAGSTVREVVRSLKVQGTTSTLTILAREMPDPRKMLDLRDIGKRTLAVA